VATDADQSRLLREAWPRQHVAKYWLLIGLGPKPNNNHYLRASAAVLLLLLIVVIVTVTVTCRKRCRHSRSSHAGSSSTQQPVVKSHHSRFTRPTAAANSLQVDSVRDTTRLDVDDGGYSRHLSVMSDNDDYLVPNPSLDLL